MVVLFIQPSAPNVCTEMPLVACDTSMWPKGSQTMVLTCFRPAAIFTADHPDEAVYVNRIAETPVQLLGTGSAWTSAWTCPAIRMREILVHVELMLNECLQRTSSEQSAHADDYTRKPHCQALLLLMLIPKRVYLGQATNFRSQRTDQSSSGRTAKTYLKSDGPEERGDRRRNLDEP